MSKKTLGVMIDDSVSFKVRERKLKLKCAMLLPTHICNLIAQRSADAHCS